MAGEHWIHELEKGTFTAQAKRRHMTVPQLRRSVLANPSRYSKKTRRRAVAARTLSRLNRGR